MSALRSQVSLVITGGHRRSDLRRFFNSIASQTYCGRIEIVFVDQAGSGVPDDIRFPENVCIRTLSVEGPLPLSAARNVALPFVTGALIAFPDDDCWYEPFLIERIVTELERNDQAGALCTRVFDPVRDLPYGGRPFGLECDIEYRNLLRYPISVGLFVRRVALEAAGFHFDERLGAGTPIGSGEETELLARMLDAGVRVRYCGSLQVFHPVPTYSVHDIPKFYRYGYGFGWLNGTLLRRGRPAVLPFLMNVAVRSAGGAALHALDPVQRGVYFNRLRGIVRGFFEAVFSRRATSK